MKTTYSYTPDGFLEEVWDNTERRLLYLTYDDTVAFGGKIREVTDVTGNQFTYPYYDDMIMLWDRLREKGYKRCCQTMLRAIRRMKLDKEPARRRNRKPKPYMRADYAGQKVQIDVKFVPSYCVSNGQKYYQYTAVDECTRFCFREMYA